MKSSTLFLSLAVAVSAHAGPKVTISDDHKAEVQIEENGSSTSGGMRQEVAIVSVKKGFFSDPMPIEEKIAALESMTSFYRLLQQQGVDPEQKVTGDYTGMKLKDVLAQLLPKMTVEFRDVDDAVTILKMTATEARLEQVLDYLDDAAGVYFTYSQGGLAITSAPLPGGNPSDA